MHVPAPPPPNSRFGMLHAGTIEATLAAIDSVEAPVSSHHISNITTCVFTQSVSGLVAEYDLVSGCKLGSIEAGGTPISLAYTSDASLLVAVLQVSRIQSSLRLHELIACTLLRPIQWTLTSLLLSPCITCSVLSSLVSSA